MRNIAALKDRSSFSRSQLTIFVILFAAIGGYLIYRSFAAAPVVASLEAEQMSLPAGGQVVTDATASGGKAILLASNGTATGIVNFPSSVTSLTVTAKGAQCQGAPAVSVFLDGTNILSAAVSATAWAAYSATPVNAVASGTHNLSISFSNDYSKTKGNSGKTSCSRAIYLDVTTFYGPTAVTPVPTVTLSASPSSLTTGQAATLTWASTNAASCTASGAWSGTQPTSGSVSTGALNQSSTYSLSCTGAGGSATAATTVTVTASTTTSTFGTSLPAPLPQSSGAQISGSSTTALSALLSNLSAGTTLCLHSGIYGQGLTSSVNLSASGTAANPITIKSCPGETAQIAQLITVSGSYIRLSNLKFVRNSYPTDSRYGQSGANPGGNVGIWLQGSHVTLEKSELSGTTMSCIFGGGSFDQILANYVHDCGTTPDDHGIYYTSDHSLIANNIFYHNYDFGIQLGYTGAIDDIVANNTSVYNGLTDPTHPGSGTVTFSGTAGNIFVNNIAAYNGQYGYKTYDTTNSLSHDDAYANPAGTTSGTFSSVASMLVLNPMFVSSTDFHLQAASPLAGAGDAAYTPPTDFYGSARSTADLGAVGH